MHNILITSAGQRVSLVRAFKNELKALFPKANVFTVDLNPILAPACHVSDGYSSICKVTDQQYIKELIAVCKNWNIGMIIPTIDTELLILAEHKSKLEDEGIHAIVSDLAFVKICRDKRLTTDFFAQKKIDTPKVYAKHNLSFPVFAKPYDGSLSKDTFLICDESELTDFHLNHPKLMFMEYIDHAQHEEYTVDGYYDKSGDLICLVPRKRIFVRAGEINKGVTLKHEVLEQLKEKLKHIDGASGCLTMQFFFNPSTKRLVGIEINPRFGGGYPLSYLAGANYPKYLIQEYFNHEHLSYFEGWESDLLMLRYDDEILVRNYGG